MAILIKIGGDLSIPTFLFLKDQCLACLGYYAQASAHLSPSIEPWIDRMASFSNRFERLKLMGSRARICKGFPPIGLSVYEK